MDGKIKLFEDRKIRAIWDSNKEDWFFSAVDIVAVLTDSSDHQKSRNYWKVLKKRLKMIAEDGKMRETDCLCTSDVLRLVQSIPSPKAEPFKMWLAKVGSERLDEIADPEKAIVRGADYYREKGYPESRINQRLQTIEMRKELTDEWKVRGIDKEKDYAILTSEMTKAWSGFTVSEYKEFKGLKKENLRDNMTNIELVLNMLAEVTTTAISKQRQQDTFSEQGDCERRWQCGKICAHRH